MPDFLSDLFECPMFLSDLFEFKLSKMIVEGMLNSFTGITPLGRDVPLTATFHRTNVLISKKAKPILNLQQSYDYLSLICQGKTL